MKKWSIGILEYWFYIISFLSILQYSNTPLLQYFDTPVLQIKSSLFI
jgi:hypothetical protein